MCIDAGLVDRWMDGMSRFGALTGVILWCPAMLVFWAAVVVGCQSIRDAVDNLPPAPPASTTTTSTTTTTQPAAQESQRFLWKPASERDGNLVVLLPARLDAAEVRVSGVIYMAGRPYTRANGNRQHTRFPVPGAAFGGPVTVGAVLKDGGYQEWQVPNGAARYER